MDNLKGVDEAGVNFWMKQEDEIIEMEMAYPEVLLREVEEPEEPSSTHQEETLSVISIMTRLSDGTEVVWDMFETRKPSGVIALKWVLREIYIHNNASGNSSSEDVNRASEEMNNVSEESNNISEEVASFQSFSSGVNVEASPSQEMFNLSMENVFVPSNPEVDHPHEQLKGVEKSANSEESANSGLDVAEKREKIKVPPRTQKKVTPKRKVCKCSHCNLQFDQPYQLKRHLRVHVGNPLYHCRICGCPYKCLTTLTKHIICVHGRIPSQRGSNTGDQMDQK